jgi:ABC-type dipeptide/oligopeptide/nickel transport system permease subunit
MIADGMKWLRIAPWISTVPGVAIMVTVLAFNLFGDGLRDALDPRLRGE